MPDSLKLWAASAFALALMTSFQAAAQDGAALAKDTIFARKILMSGIAANLTEISGMLASRAALDLEDAKFHADMISIMLMSFPHLFPNSSNQWRPGVERDPGTDTLAAPEIWARYADFYAKAADASQLAYRASRAERESDFRDLIPKLEAACTGCHTLYQKTDDP